MGPFSLMFNTRHSPSVSLSVQFGQAAQLLVQAFAAAGSVGIRILGKLFGCPEQMGQAGLPELCGPGAVQRVLIGNQDTVPVVDELEEGLFASRGIDEEEGRKGGNHDPDVFPDFASGFPFRAKQAPHALDSVCD